MYALRFTSFDIQYVGECASLSLCECLSVSVCVCALRSLCSTRHSSPPRQLLSAISHVSGDVDVVRRIITRSLRSLSLPLSLFRSYTHALPTRSARSLCAPLSLSLYALRSVFSVFFSSTLGQCFDSHFPLSASISTSSYYEYQRSPIESIASASPPFLLLSFSLCFSCCSCCCCFVPIKFI